MTNEQHTETRLFDPKFPVDIEGQLLQIARQHGVALYRITSGSHRVIRYELRAKLGDVDDWGRERWHEQACTYVRSDAQYPCDCMRQDLEQLLNERDFYEQLWKRTVLGRMNEAFDKLDDGQWAADNTTGPFRLSGAYEQEFQWPDG